MNNSHTGNSVRPLALATASEGVHTLKEKMSTIKSKLDSSESDGFESDGDNILETKAKELGISYNKILPTGMLPSFEEVGLYLPPPEGYVIGNVYLKQKLFSEATHLENKINKYGIDEKGLEKRKLFLEDALGEERKGLARIKSIGRAVFYGVRTNYEGRASYAYAKCEDYSDKMAMIKKREQTIDCIISDNFAPRLANDNKSNNQRVELYKTELEESKSEYSDVKKKAFDAYTTLVVFSAYVVRIKHELHRIAFGNPSKKFEMLRNSDQLI